MAAAVEFEKAEGYPDCIRTPEDVIKLSSALSTLLNGCIPRRDDDAPPRIIRKVLLRLETEMRNRDRGGGVRLLNCQFFGPSARHGIPIGQARHWDHSHI